MEYLEVKHEWLNLDGVLVIIHTSSFENYLQEENDAMRGVRGFLLCAENVGNHAIHDHVYQSVFSIPHTCSYATCCVYSQGILILRTYSVYAITIPVPSLAQHRQARMEQRIQGRDRLAIWHGLEWVLRGEQWRNRA